MTTKTEYRMLGKWEPVRKGDEYLWRGVWEKSSNWRNQPPEQMSGTQYRRPLSATPAFVPQWKHPDAPGCPVHVLWAESPVGTPTVSQVAAEAKSEASVDPGAGYRLLGPEEMVLAGDHFRGFMGAWVEVEGTIGQKQGECGWVVRRKLPVPEPQYRPYANAAEAAAGLQGKLITNGPPRDEYRVVSRIGAEFVNISGSIFSFEELLTYKFTDGTPCGVLNTNQGTK